MIFKPPCMFFGIIIDSIIDTMHPPLHQSNFGFNYDVWLPTDPNNYEVANYYTQDRALTT